MEPSSVVELPTGLQLPAGSPRLVQVVPCIQMEPSSVVELPTGLQLPAGSPRLVQVVPCIQMEPSSVVELPTGLQLPAGSPRLVQVFPWIQIMKLCILLSVLVPLVVRIQIISSRLGLFGWSRSRHFGPASTPPGRLRLHLDYLFNNLRKLNGT